ncbi:MAG: SDR family oxidoreductase [Chloroflexi bacterium]|nr:SDR family oxidoreductase [Chloroflexota bacterium]
MELRNKGALLVGTRRVGERVALRLAEEGVNLAIVYRRSRDEAEKLQRAVSPSVDKTALMQADLSVENDVERIVKDSAEQLGGLHFVINLASDYPRAPFESLDSVAWDRAMGTAKSSYLLAVHAGRHLSRNPGRSRGHIVMFSDWAAGETPYVDYLPYLTAKAAVDFMTRGFAAELASKGIQVNSIAPGPTMRPPEISEQSWQDDVLAKAPLNRESSPDDIAEIIVALLKSETITGETIRVDSGRHLAGPGVERN